MKIHTKGALAISFYLCLVNTNSMRLNIHFLCTNKILVINVTISTIRPERSMEVNVVTNDTVNVHVHKKNKKLVHVPVRFIIFILFFLPG